MLGMRWLLEVFLQMHKRPGRLNQRLIKTRQLRVFLHQPKLFEHIVGFIIFLRIPQLEKCSVIILRRGLPRTPARANAQSPKSARVYSSKA